MANAQAPIVARLERLDQALAEFLAEPESRIICFQLGDDEERLFEGFVRLREEEPLESYVLVSCDEPFASRATHGITLVQGLLKSEQERAEELAAEDVYDIPWTPPPSPTRIERRRGEPPPDQTYLVSALSSLHERHCARGQRLLLCLLPQAISDVETYARWLSELGFLLADADVRLCVTCELGRSWGHALSRAHPVRVRLLPAALDMPAALEEISRSSDDFEEPSGRFRHSFVQATNAIRAQDLDRLREHTEVAANIARAEGWAHLEFAAQQLLGAGSLSLGDLRGAFAAFENAERATHHDIRFGATWISPLLLQARLSKGSVAVTGGVWPLGARIFAEEALPVAKALGDRRSELECRRLASYCEERAGSAQRAREHLIAALAIGESLPPAERRQTTLPFVGEALMRSARGLAQRGERAQYDKKLRELLGKDWEQLTQHTSATPEEAEAAVDDWLRTASPNVPIQGPTGTHVIAKTQSIQRTLTAAVDPEVALAQLMANPEGTLDADAFIEMVSRTWDTRGNAPKEWSQPEPEAPHVASAAPEVEDGPR